MQRPATLVLFDIDGTLLHPNGCGRAAMELAMREVFGQPVDIGGHDFSGKTDWQILAEVLNLRDDVIRAQMSVFEQVMARHLEMIINDYDVQPCPGAHAVISALSAEPAALVGLLTGNLHATTAIKLRAAGFAPELFRVGAYGSEAHWRDELPPLALARAEMLLGARIPGRRVVIVGDTENDVICGRGIGARSLAVATGFASRARLEASKPDYLFDDLSDLDAVVEAVFDHGMDES